MSGIRYGCGCEVVPLDQVPPGVALSFTNPNAIEDAGWFKERNEKNGDHWLKPCAKHSVKAEFRRVRRMVDEVLP